MTRKKFLGNPLSTKALNCKLHHLSRVARKPVFGSPTRSDTNRAVPPQKMARSLKFRVWDSIIYLAKTKALISCAVTAQLICDFVFAYAKISFSHVAAYFIVILMLQSHDNQERVQKGQHVNVGFNEGNFFN